MLTDVRADGGEEDSLPLDILEHQLAAHPLLLPAQLPVLVPGRLQLKEAGAQRLLEQQLLVGLVRQGQLTVHLHEEDFVVEAGGPAAPAIHNYTILLSAQYRHIVEHAEQLCRGMQIYL